MQKQELKLSFPQHGFSEVYFKSLNENGFDGSALKSAAEGLVRITLILLLVLLYHLIFPVDFLMIILAIIWSVHLTYYLFCEWSLNSWRNQTEHWLIHKEACEHNSIELSEGGIILKHDQLERRIAWDKFRGAEIHEDYIILKGERSLIISKQWLSDSAFRQVAVEIDQRINRDQANSTD